LVALLVASGALGSSDANRPGGASRPNGVVATVTIYPNGSVSAAGVFAVTGNDYALQANYTGAIADERNGSWLDGGNWTVTTAAYAAGVTVFAASGVRVEFFNVTSTGGGIAVLDSTLVDVDRNTVATAVDAFEVNDSSSVTISGNIGRAVVGLFGTGDTGLTANRNDLLNATDNGVFVEKSDSVDVDGNDLANARGYALFGSTVTDLTVVDNNLSSPSSGSGLLVVEATVGNLSFNTLYGDAYPIELEDSVDFALWNDSMSDSPVDAVALYECSGITVGDTSAPGATQAGVFLYQDEHVALVGLDFLDSAFGVTANSSGDVSIRDSNLGSGNTAVDLENSYNVSVIDSELTDPNAGIFASNTTGVFVDGSNLSRANNPVYVVDGSYDVVVDRSDLDEAQFGAVYVNDSSDVTVENSSLHRAANFGIIANDSEDLTFENLNLSGTAASPETVGVSTSNDLGVTLENVAINWTQDPFTDVGSRGVRIADSFLANATPGGDAISLGGDQQLAVTSTDLAGGQGAGLVAESVGDLAVTDCDFQQIQENGIAFTQSTGLVVTGSSFNGDGESGVYTSTSEEIAAANDSASGVSYGFFVDTDDSVSVVNSTALNDSSGGIAVNAGSGLTVVGDDLSDDGSGAQALSLTNVPQFSVLGNELANDSLAVQLEGLSNGTVVGNEFVNDSVSIWLDGPVSAAVYHNDFDRDGGWQLEDTATSTWNASYPTGGNYWSNYTGSDLFHGPGQNVSGGDGIGDTPMVLNATTADHYPLMVPWAEHDVVFLESGLPTGTSWGLVLNGTRWTTTSNSVVVDSTTGAASAYTYSILAVAGFTATPATGSGEIGATAGGSNVVRVAYAPVVLASYPVDFVESGLAVGTSWSVTLSGATESSTNATIQFIRENGSYEFTVGALAGESVVPGAGTVPVSGAPVTKDVNFTAVTYAVDAHESGLPAGTAWSVDIAGTTTPVTGTNVTRDLPNGSYAVALLPVPGYTGSPGSTTVVVNGGPADLYVVFSANASRSSLPGSSPVPNLTPAQSTTLLWVAIVALAVAALVGWGFAFRRGPKGGTPKSTSGDAPSSTDGPSPPPGPFPPPSG
jgi:nitrous oxidase accessory protein NosD